MIHLGASVEAGEIVDLAPPPEFAVIKPSGPREAYIRYGAWLSIRYAIDGNPVAPNSTVIRQAKSDYPELPGMDSVIAGLGSVPVLAEELGFVTRDLAKRWTDEEYIQNGTWLSHVLGSAEHPVMPRKKDLAQAVRLHVGPPYEYIEHRFGDLAGFQSRLGFVTPATLERWTDQDWIDNGIWLSHMLGSPEEPVMPTFRDILLASKHNIGPSLHTIYDKYGDLVKYQVALGFKCERPDYTSWNRATYIQNGRWFSQVLGSPERPKMPTHSDIDEGTQIGLVPPTTAIVKRFRSFSAYQDALGFVTPATLERWTDQDWIDNGIWLSHMLGSPEEPVMPTKEQLELAADLNLVPKRTQIVEKFGGIMHYQKALGFHNAQYYRTWTERDYLRYCVGLAQDKKWRRISEADLDQSDGPSSRAIQTRFGGLAALNERLGFTDYRRPMTNDELVGFGVRLAFRLKGRAITGGVLDSYSSTQNGPSSSRIKAAFGGMKNYREQVEEGLQVYGEVRTRYLSEGYSRPSVDFALRDFQNTPECLEVLQERVNVMRELSRRGHVKIATLCKAFERSRITALWDKEDFLYFKGLLGDVATVTTADTVQLLGLLDKLGLAPYLDDIEEVFGSLEAFAEQ